MKRRTAVYGIGLVFLVLLGGWLSIRWAADEGFRRGLAAGADAQYHLQLVWADVRHMSEHDRRVLAYLAMRCRLDREPMAAENVVGCLQRAAAEPESAVRPAALARLLPPEYATSNDAP
jgi:hypothetical protein